MSSTRHSWDEGKRFLYKTERQCTRCGMIKVTRHPTTYRSWTEYFCDGEWSSGAGTPPCPGVRATLASERRE